MIIFLSIGFLLLALLLVAAAMVRYPPLPRRRGEVGRPVLRGIDIASFRHLISKEEDLFLRQSLKPHAYRVVKRARTRAVQEYLWWIAENCASLLAIAKSAPVSREQSAEQLIQGAVRLRMIALVLYCGQWLQWIFPGLDLTPSNIARRYQQTLAYARPYLQPRQHTSELSPL